MSSHIVKTYPASKIRAPMVEGAVVNAECKLVQKVPLGEYTAFIGEVVEISHNPEKRPIVYHQGRLWRIQDFERPPTLFVTATYIPETKSILIQGRMRKGDPGGKVELLIVQDDKTIYCGTTKTDGRGFYEHQFGPADPDGKYIIEARSGNLSAKATLLNRNNLRGL